MSTERVQATIPTLLKLAWPIVISRSTQAVVGLADALMVAHLGEDSLAATTTGAMNAMCFFILPMGTVFIVSSFASQYFGKGDLAGARRHAWYGLWIAGGTQLVAMLALPVLGNMLGVLSFSPGVTDLLHQYLAIRMLAGGAVVGMEALGNYYGGLGNTRLPMIANLAAMVMDLIGNYLLIDGRFGLPALGVVGAAWGSVVSTVVAFLFLLYRFLQDKSGGRVWEELNRTELWRLLKFGLPSGLNWFFEFFAFLFFVDVVVAGLGTTSLAAMMSVLQLNSVAFMPAFAIASAASIVVGQAIGAGFKDDVPRAVKLSFLLAGTWQGAIGALYLFAPRLAFSPFVRGENSAALWDAGARMLALSAGWQLFDAAASTLAESLRAAGDTSYTLWARIFLAWAVFVPGSWVTVRYFHGGEVGAMLWLTAYLGLLALILYLRFKGGAWRRFELTEALPSV